MVENHWPMRTWWWRSLDRVLSTKSVRRIMLMIILWKFDCGFHPTGHCIGSKSRIWSASVLTRIAGELGCWAFSRLFGPMWVHLYTFIVPRSNSSTLQNGRIVDGLGLFKKNVSLHFEGQVECAICYSCVQFPVSTVTKVWLASLFSVISVTDGSLPKKPCKTCKNRFHAGCLFKVSIYFVRTGCIVTDPSNSGSTVAIRQAALSAAQTSFRWEIYWMIRLFMFYIL